MMATKTIKQRYHSLTANPRVQTVITHFPPLNFITLHYTYFLVTILFFSGIFYSLSSPHHAVSYIDCLFLVTSAMTEAGLNTVNLSQLTTAQQVILWWLIVVGSAIFVSIGTVGARKRAFERRFMGIVEKEKERVRMEREAREGRDGRRSWSVRRGVPEDVTRLREEKRETDERKRSDGGMAMNDENENAILDSTDDITPVNPRSQDEALEEGIHNRRGSLPILEKPPSHILFSIPPTNPQSSSSAYALPHGQSRLTHRPTASSQDPDSNPTAGNLHDSHYPTYLSPQTIGRNATFFNLSREEREHLGGVEYRAISLLAWLIPVYFVLFQLCGCLGLGAYMSLNKRSVAEMNGVNAWWLGLFNGVSAFNNSGMSLLDANLIPFQTSVYTLMTMGFLILAGNTAYPLFLRLILWAFHRSLCYFYPSPSSHPALKSTLLFILRYPRRVYTNLFPSTQTWWLLFMVCVLNGIDWAAFELLNIGNAAVEAIPHQYRVLDGLFQAFAVRSGGFYIIAIPSLRIGLQLLYVIMMYISVYPVVITMRHSNVYEERSLGIYTSSDTPDSEHPISTTLIPTLKRTLTTPNHHSGVGVNTQTFIRTQIRSQLSHDIWWLVLAVLTITCIEVSAFERDPVTFSVFNIIFEAVSAYGCVGISTGLSDEAYSFSGAWSTSSKVVLCAVMVRGRHRGLPVSLDRAVRLPGDRVAPGDIEGEDGGRGRSKAKGKGKWVLGQGEERERGMRRSLSMNFSVGDQDRRRVGEV